MLILGFLKKKKKVDAAKDIGVQHQLRQNNCLYQAVEGAVTGEILDLSMFFFCVVAVAVLVTLSIPFLRCRWGNR